MGTIIDAGRPPARVLIPATLDALLLPAADAGLRQLFGTTMGTCWSARFVPGLIDDAALLMAIQAALDVVVEQMSTWLPSSAISRFNDAPAGSRHTLPAGFVHVLRAALALARDSGGAYDPAVGALVDLWGYGPAGARTTLPSAEAIAAARACCGWRRLSFDDRRASLMQPGGLRLDLSSIAKGYAVDQVCEVLCAHGVEHFLVEIGGELRGLGCKPDGTPWWVDIERHDDDDHLAPLRVALHGLAVATSGDARRCFVADGRRCSHTLDPRSGWPIADTLASVTVLHPSCMLADGLATAIAVLGPSQGLEFAERRAIAARIVERADGVALERTTAAFRQMLE
ncbi:FAD:protein FMN transferase [Solimonas terrae]|uniref:FAD:protein FMN transferase n=1 Tax=Solimonas terrae TaxID=1396819 RepID=UPI0034503EF0